ncbi:hypothetical protein B0E33_01335 [Roseibium algicola]|uniref:Uncharacterized protein n=1 Tax=Roseibium algicola TaxID=2857014 RepID=A0ABN4WKQ5_9HYPH|nr:hypothetical protein [Roseibium aggregatum]AQQ02398.1 hypothetical protein B0E33_01335 [Roseibium aggregatum]
MNRIPDDIVERLLAVGPVEWGETATQSDEEHINQFRNTLNLTRDNFDLPDETALQGVYLEGSETIICHTGPSPNSAAHARIIVATWNHLLELAKAQLAAEAKP